MRYFSKPHVSFYIISLLVLPFQVIAGGFGVTVQSAIGGGNAATGHAMAEDASAMWYNPALLSSVEGQQLNTGLSLLNTKIDVVNTGSTIPSAAAGFPVIGDNTVDPGSLSVTPSLFYKRAIPSRAMAFGVGVNVPFGVSTEYENDSFTRYESTATHLKTINVNPAVSWRVNKKLDVGAGLNIQVGQATLDKAIDSFLVCKRFESLNLAPAGTCTALGLTSPSNVATDGKVSVEASGIGYGANIGAVYRPNTKTTFSVGLRSSINYRLKGDADFTHSSNLLNIGAANLAAAGLADQDAEADLKMPASASFAFARSLTNKLTVHGDITWTQWSSVPEIRIEFPDTIAADSITDTQWKDTTRVGAGLTYKMNDKTTLRTGIALDPSSTPGPRNRTPRAPSSDNLWFSGGVSHQISKKLIVDASLSIVHPEKVAINYTAPGSSDYLTRADTDSEVLVGSVSVNYRF